MRPWSSKRVLVFAVVFGGVLALYFPAFALQAPIQRRGAASRHGASASSRVTSPASDSDELLQDPNPVANDAAELSKDVGISTADAETAIQLQPEVGQLQASLASRNDISFGGLYIDYNPYRVVVLASLGESSEVISAIADADLSDLDPFTKVIETEFTQPVLLAARADLGALDTQGLVTTSDVNIRAGDVLLTAATPEDVASFQATVNSARLPIPSDHVVIQVGGFTDQDTSYGGRNMNSSNGDCTSGFSVHQTAGGSANGITDAAHCPNGGVSEAGISLNFQDGQWGGSQDVQWFTTGVSDENKINDGSGTRSITDATQRSDMSMGDSVCHYGRTSGFGCGTIASVDFDSSGFDSHSYNSTFIRVNNDSTQGGDSGCPWFSGHSAFGIHKGITNGGDPVFMAQNYMHALDIQVKTS